MAEQLPRSLKPRERAVLDFLLAVEAPGVDELRAQARTAQVVGRCSCGCATIDIAVDRSQARTSAFTSSPAIEATTPQSDDPAAFFELLLFVEDGWLSSVEIVSYGAEPPREFPLPHVFLPPRTRG